VENGLDGLELYYPNIDIRKKNKLVKIAKKRGLLLTGGSDFHGLNRVGIDIGVEKIPISIYEKLRDRKKSQKI
jgi:predicted metal-dependent phosphoesterase TrpH